MTNNKHIAQCITNTKQWWRTMFQRAKVAPKSDMVFYTTCKICEDRIHQLDEVHVFFSDGGNLDDFIICGAFEEVISGTVQQIYDLYKNDLGALGLDPATTNSVYDFMAVLKNSANPHSDLNAIVFKPQIVKNAKDYSYNKPNHVARPVQYI